MSKQEQTKRQCKPSLTATYRKIDIDEYCNTCSERLWEITTTLGVSYGCKQCTSIPKIKRT